jgi:hypothetical protein
MRVLMVSWEYPPVVVGGLSRHVHALARHLTRDGHDVGIGFRRGADHRHRLPGFRGRAGPRRDDNSLRRKLGDISEFKLVVAPDDCICP